MAPYKRKKCTFINSELASILNIMLGFGRSGSLKSSSPSTKCSGTPLIMFFHFSRIIGNFGFLLMVGTNGEDMGGREDVLRIIFGFVVVGRGGREDD